MKVGDIRKNKGKPVIGVTPTDTLSAAVALLATKRIGSLVVLDAGELVGIITERDLVGVLDTNPDTWAAMPVADAMTPNPIVCDPESTLKEVMSLMMENSIRHLPMVHDGKLEGMLSITDIVDQLLEAAKFENKLLKNYIQNWPDGEEGS